MIQAIEHMVIDEEELEQMTSDQIWDQMVMEQQVMDYLAKNPGSNITIKQDYGNFKPEVSCPLILLGANSKNTKGIITRYLTNLLEYRFKCKKDFDPFNPVTFIVSESTFEEASNLAEKFIYAYDYLIDNVGKENLERPYDEDDLYIEKYNYHYFVPYMMNLLFEQATD